MLAVVKPSPLRLWGFLLTALGGASIAFASVSTWAAVSLGGSTVGAIPTKGIDLWQGKVTLALGAAIVVGILALRFVGPERRRMVATGILIAAGLALAIAVWCVLGLDSVVHDTGVDRLAGEVADLLGTSQAHAQALVRQALAHVGFDVEPQVGLWLAILGGVLAVGGGILDLAWVRRKQRAGDTIDPDTPSGARVGSTSTADAT